MLKTHPIQITRMTVSHGDAISQIDLDANGYVDAWEPREWVQRGVYVATREDVPVGAVAVALLPRSDQEGCIAHILRIVVREDVRRRGVGSHLLCRVRRKAHYGRIGWLTVYVPEDRLGAQLFFAARRFLATGPVEEDAFFGGPSIFMRRRLS